jgi:hypothetical protein
LSEGAQFLSDAGRELQFYKDVVEMLDKGYRKQSEGEWIENKKVRSSPYCSICSAIAYKSPYCPHCGAKMKRGAECNENS